MIRFASLREAQSTWMGAVRTLVSCLAFADRKWVDHKWRPFPCQRLTKAALSAALLLAARDGAVADPARLEAYGRHLAQECTSCHRLDGVDNGIPSIVGWDAMSFKETLQFYKTGARSNPAMSSVANSLDSEQMDALAAYFGKLAKSKPGTDHAKTR